MGWLLIAIVFAVLWVYAIYREDVHNPEPCWMVMLAMGAGMLAVPAADRVEQVLLPDLSVLDGALAGRVFAAFMVSGPVEETLKLVGVLLLVWPWTHFDEPVDGIVYGAAAGAGFALVENLLFMEGQPEVILARGPVGTGAHVLFSALWGGALGHAGHLKGLPARAGLVLLGLAVGSLAHGAFNMITLSVGHELTLNQGRLAQIILILLCLLGLRWRLRALLRKYPFRFAGGGPPRR